MRSQVTPVAEGGVDAIYVATPPSEHAVHALLCIEAGIPVLVEKPFASSAADVLRAADSVFAMEAMWTRLPNTRPVYGAIASSGESRFINRATGATARQLPTFGVR